MARYCFHVHGGICFAQDFEVRNLPDLAAARGAARHVAEHFRSHMPPHLRQRALTVEIEEEAGPGHTSICFPGSEITKPHRLSEGIGAVRQGLS
jgi:hypothetical protein